MASSCTSLYGENSPERITVQFVPTLSAYAVMAEVARPSQDTAVAKIGELTLKAENDAQEIARLTALVDDLGSQVVGLEARIDNVQDAVWVEQITPFAEENIEPELSESDSEDESAAAPVPSEPESQKVSKAEMNRLSMIRRGHVLEATLQLVDATGQFVHNNVSGEINRFAQLKSNHWGAARNQLESMGCLEFEKPTPRAKRSNAVRVHANKIVTAIQENKILPLSNSELEEKLASLMGKGEDSSVPTAVQIHPIIPISPRVRRAMELSDTSPKDVSTQGPGGSLPVFLGQSRRSRSGNAGLARKEDVRKLDFGKTMRIDFALAGRRINIRRQTKDFGELPAEEKILLGLGCYSNLGIKADPDSQQIYLRRMINKAKASKEYITDEDFQILIGNVVTQGYMSQTKEGLLRLESAAITILEKFAFKQSKPELLKQPSENITA